MELIESVKQGLGITGNFLDNTLQIYIDEVKGYMKSSGVSDDLINSTCSIGVIVRGVSDLWNYGTGTANFSQYFIQRVIQLRLEGDNDDKL